MLDAIAIQSTDTVVELAPGLGATARLTLAENPRAYIAVERDGAAATHVKRLLRGEGDRCMLGSASETGLDCESVDVVFGEAKLSMQTDSQKDQIIGEANRVLKPGGRYAIHELGLTPDSLDQATKDAVQRDLSAAIHVGVRPLTIEEWRATIEAQGLIVDADLSTTAPMHLLEPRRVLQDEGLLRTLRIALNVARDSTARHRILAMRRLFRKYDENLCAAMLIARKPCKTTALSTD